MELTLTKAVQLQSLADVPLGSFLWGGIDYSLITALLKAQRPRSLRTFTIGFEEAGFNKVPYARAIVAHLGTEHSETMLTSADTQSLIPQLPQLNSDPFADRSQLPNHLVCREARRSGLSVASSGDGGDELFGGYSRYFWGPLIWSRLAWLLRRLFGWAIHLLPPAGWDAMGNPLPIATLGHKAHKLADRLAHVHTTVDLYRFLVSEWRDPAALLQPGADATSVLEPSSLFDWPLPEGLNPDPVARLPMAMKIRVGIGKWALRHIFYKHVPRNLIERPNAGFGMSIGQWLRGPLRPWAEDLLNPAATQSQGYLCPEPIQHLWQQHLSGRFDQTSRLWTVLMWQAWLEEWRRSDADTY